MAEDKYTLYKEFFGGGTVYCPTTYLCKLHAKWDTRDMTALEKTVEDFTKAYDLVVDPMRKENDIHFYAEDQTWEVRPPVLTVWVGGKNIQQIRQRRDKNETNMFNLVGDADNIQRSVVSTTPLILNEWGRRFNVVTYNFGRAKMQIFPDFETIEEYEKYLDQKRKSRKYTKIFEFLKHFF